jgi:small subunit ribosomal protein S8
MAMTDPLGDMLTRIRNGQRAKKDTSFRRLRSCAPACSKCSSAKATSAALQRGRHRQAHPQLRIELKYFEGEPAIKHVARVSKPGRRVYSGSARNCR